MLKAYLKLLRYPLAVTAVANVISGYFLAHGPSTPESWRLGLAALASVLLYSAGMILNDVFDAARDRALGRQRPIPDGEISRSTAAGLGAAHLLAGVLIAASLGFETLLWASATSILVVLYDSPVRRLPLVGVTLMSLARGANVLIGVGAGGGVQRAWNLEWLVDGMNDPGEVWLLPLAIALYTACVTLESLREDHLGSGRVLPRLPFDIAYYCLPAAILGSIMCDNHAPFAQIFWIFPALLGFADGRAYAARPAMMAARRTVRDGLLTMPCIDAVVVSTVISEESRLAGIVWGAAVAALGLVAYGLMRLSTPSGQTPTADDPLDTDGQDVAAPQRARFHVEERSTNHLALADGTFTPGGTWHVLRCQIGAKAPARFLLGIGEIDPESPGLLTMRLRASDRDAALGLAEAFARSLCLPVPAPFPAGGPGWLDMRARLIAEGVHRQDAAPPELERATGSEWPADDSGDWSYYEAKWTTREGGRNLTMLIGVNELVGLGEITFLQPGTGEQTWAAFVATLAQS